MNNFIPNNYAFDYTNYDIIRNFSIAEDCITSEFLFGRNKQISFIIETETNADVIEIQTVKNNKNSRRLYKRLVTKLSMCRSP